jgi:hypothetical protein
MTENNSRDDRAVTRALVAGVFANKIASYSDAYETEAAVIDGLYWDIELRP